VRGDPRSVTTKCTEEEDFLTTKYTKYTKKEDFDKENGVWGSPGAIAIKMNVLKWR
jgi:hypothetical protein